MRSKDKKLEGEIYAYVAGYCEYCGCGPTVRDVAKRHGIAVSTAHGYLSGLREEGALVNGPAQNYEPADFALNRNAAMVEIVGTISCGPLAEATQRDCGAVRLPRALVGKGEFFILEASGDSMIGAGIESGDLILVRRDARAEPGKIVVALRENETALKRLMFDERRNAYYLHPENPEYEDIYVTELKIQGVAEKIIKNPK